MIVFYFDPLFGVPFHQKIQKHFFILLLNLKVLQENKNTELKTLNMKN
jgi:hypothetical protein